MELRYDPLKLGGVLYVIAAFQFLSFELVAETLYPDYSVGNNYISDLGATCIAPPSTTSCVVHQPSATIFDTTVFLLGLFLFVGTILVYQGTRKKAYGAITVVADLAILLVGIFPENTGWIHVVISEVIFIFVGISLILAWTIIRGGLFRYLPVVFGVLTLFFTVGFRVSAIVGNGGEERLLVLSALLGTLALGGYLAGQDSIGVIAEQKVPARSA